MKNTKLLLGLAVMIWQALPVPHGTPAARAEGTAHSAEVQRLIAAAKDKKEEELAFSWSGNQFEGSVGVGKFEALFNRLYGLNIKFHFTPGPSMTQMAGKITQEAAAGHRASTDVFLGTESHYSALLDRDVMEPYDYPRLSPKIGRNLVAPKNIGVEIYTTISGIPYNTTLVAPAEAPRRLKDVLNPKWKGRIASTVNAAYLDRVAMRPEWGAEKMKAFVKKLSEHVGGLLRVGEQSRIVSGEFVMLIMGNRHDIRKERARGAPVAHAIPEDGLTLTPGYMGIPRNALHPNLAKLFIHTILSEPGQKIIYETDFTDHYELPGSQSATELRELKEKGVAFTKIDINFALEHPEMRQLGIELRKILQKGR